MAQNEYYNLVKQNYYRNYQIRNGVTQYDTGWQPYDAHSNDFRQKDSSLVKIPGWKRMKVKPFVPYNLSITRIKRQQGSMGRGHYSAYYDPFPSRVQLNTFNDNLNTAADFGENLTTPVMPTVDDPIPIAERKLLAKLNTAKSSSAVTLAELPKTVKSVAKTATKIAGALRALRRFDIDGLAKALEIKVTRKERIRMGRKRREYFLDPTDSDILSVKDKYKRFNYSYTDSFVKRDRYRTKDFFGDLWLEYSYGWKPLLSDVYSHAEALAEYLVQHQNVVRRESARASSSREKSSSGSVSPDWAYFRYTKVSKRGQVGVRYSNENVNPANVFGLLNPLQVAWELVPFSFVVDWFLPIGNAIESLTATDGLTFHSGYKSYFVEARNDWTSFGNKPYGSADSRWVPYGSLKSGKVEIVFQRSVLSNFPSPSFPAFKDWRSLSHGASAIALLNSLFLSKR